MYKIINTTDKQNLGLIIEKGQEIYELRDEYIFKPTFLRIVGKYMFLSNANYIITSKEVI